MGPRVTESGSCLESKERQSLRRQRPAVLLSPGEVAFTFTGDTVGQQLVAHKARADDLLPRVSALLLAGPAAWNQSACEPRPDAHQRPSGFPAVWPGPEKTPSGWTDTERQAGAHPRLHRTPPFPWETPGSGSGYPAAAASAASPGLMNGAACRAASVGYGGAGRGGREECDAAAWHRHGGSRPHKGGRALKRPSRPPTSLRPAPGPRPMTAASAAAACTLLPEHRYTSPPTMLPPGQPVRCSKSKSHRDKPLPGKDPTRQSSDCCPLLQALLLSFHPTQLHPHPNPNPAPGCYGSACLHSCCPQSLFNVTSWLIHPHPLQTSHPLPEEDFPTPPREDYQVFWGSLPFLPLPGLCADYP